MRIWIATVSEQVPLDSSAERLLRGGIWAHELARRGHQVVWWTDNVDHMRKRVRSRQNTSVSLAANLELRMVAGPGYKRNISAARLLHYRTTSRELGRWMSASELPDVCIAALPALEWVNSALNVGESKRFPVVVDCRDMWPDLFVDLLPAYLRWPGRLALSPLFRQKQRALRRAFAISGITAQFLEWGLTAAGREHNGLDFVAHHAYPAPEYGEDILAECAEWWDRAGIVEDRGLLTICFFGMLASGFDFEPVMMGLRRMGNRAPEIRLIICGEGPNLRDIQRSAYGLDGVYFAGHVSGAHIKTMMDRSDVALAPYVGTRNFMSNIPGKISEYLSAGLPVLSGIGGTIGAYLTSNQCGWRYSGAAGFAESVANLIDEPDLRLRAKERAKEAFERDFRADRVVAQAERALRLIADRWGGWRGLG